MRFYREKAGFTQKQLADLAGVSQAYISKLENGTVNRISKKVIIQISTLLKICPCKLLFLLFKLDCSKNCFNHCEDDFF